MTERSTLQAVLALMDAIEADAQKTLEPRPFGALCFDVAIKHGMEPADLSKAYGAYIEGLAG